MNWRAGGPFAQREWRAGDRAWAGAWIAQIAGRSTRSTSSPGWTRPTAAQLKTGLDADVEVQAVGSRPAPARITAFSALAKVDFGPIWPPPRLFDVQLDLVTPEPGAAARHDGGDQDPPRQGAAGAARADAGAVPADAAAASVAGSGSGHAGRGVRARHGAASSAAASASRGAGPTSRRSPTACEPGEKVALERPEEIVEP